MKVLIVDDDPSTRSLLTELLEADGFEVFAAKDGSAALALARDCRQLDGVLMDYHMPGMDGCTCLRAIQEMGHLNHVLMFLMSAEWPAQTLADELGVGFIRKPFDLSALTKRLRGPPPARARQVAA